MSMLHERSMHAEVERVVEPRNGTSRMQITSSASAFSNDSSSLVYRVAHRVTHLVGGGVNSLVDATVQKGSTTTLLMYITEHEDRQKTRV